MNYLKLIAISCVVIISVIILLVITHLLTKNIKSRINNEGRLKLSFGIWYSAIFLSGSNVISTIIDIVFEVIDNLIKIEPTNFYRELIGTISLVIGAGFIWFILWFLVVNFLTKIVPLKFNENEEMEDDNFSYFVVKASILIGIIFSISSVLKLILKVLVPNVEIPFYH